MTAVWYRPPAILPAVVRATPVAELVQIWPPDAARVMEVAADVRKAVGAGVTAVVMLRTVTGVFLWVVSLTPSWPWRFLPNVLTVPSAKRTAVRKTPHATAVALEEIPKTWTGV
jgi:hypothetical protein